MLSNGFQVRDVAVCLTPHVDDPTWSFPMETKMLYFHSGSVPNYFPHVVQLCNFTFPLRWTTEILMNPIARYLAIVSGESTEFAGVPVWSAVAWGIYWNIMRCLECWSVWNNWSSYPRAFSSSFVQCFLYLYLVCLCFYVTNWRVNLECWRAWRL